MVLSILEAAFQPKTSFRVIFLSIPMFLPVLKRANIHIILSHQFPLSLINAMFDHSFVILPLSLHEEVPALLSQIERPCEFCVILEVYLHAMPVLVSKVMLSVVHLIIEVVNNAFVCVRFRLTSEVNTIFVFFDHWVREIDIEIFDEFAECFIYLLYC